MENFNKEYNLEFKNIFYIFTLWILKLMSPKLPKK